jgi:hypothetical protein
MAQYEDITIDQGTDFAMELQLGEDDGSVKDLTNYTVSAKIKKTYNTDPSEAVVFNTIIADAVQGIATLSLNNTTTANIKAGRYVYDVDLSFVDSDGNTIIERLLEGKVTITPSVTR